MPTFPELVDPKYRSIFQEQRYAPVVIRHADGTETMEEYDDERPKKERAG